MRTKNISLALQRESPPALSYMITAATSGSRVRPRRNGPVLLFVALPTLSFPAEVSLNVGFGTRPPKPAPSALKLSWSIVFRSWKPVGCFRLILLSHAL
jgi:hypothetical protein